MIYYFRKLMAIITPVLILSVSIMGYRNLVAQKDEPVPKQQFKEIPIVETIKVEEFEGDLEIKIHGTVTPYREIEVSAEVAGRLAFKSERCNTGRFAPAQSLLMKIDTVDYDLEFQSLFKELEEAVVTLKELEVQIQNSQSLLELATSELQLQQRELGRAQQLRLKNAVTESQLVKANQALLTSQTVLETQKNELRLLKTRRYRLTRSGEKILIRLKKAYLDLQRTIVTSPVDGVLVKTPVEQGEYIRVGDPLFTLEDTSAAEVSCNLKMEELAWIWQQTKEEPYSESLDKKDPSVSQQTLNSVKENALSEVFQNQLNEHQEISAEVNKLLASVKGEDFDQIHEKLIIYIDRLLKSPNQVTWQQEKKQEESDQSSGFRSSYELPNIPVKVVYSIQGVDYFWDGVLSRYDGIGLDVDTRMVPCRILVSNPLKVRSKQKSNDAPPPALLRGMYVQLIIYVTPRAPLLKLPVDAIHPGGNIWTVKNGKLHIVSIKIAHQTDHQVYIYADKTKLLLGDEVIVSPLATIEEGLPVQTK